MYRPKLPNPKLYLLVPTPAAPAAAPAPGRVLLLSTLAYALREGPMRVHMQWRKPNSRPFPLWLCLYLTALWEQ